MEITKSKILNILIISVLSIPLDEEVERFVVDYIQAHPAISQALHLLKKSFDNSTRWSDDIKTKVTENIRVSAHSESIPSALKTQAQSAAEKKRLS